MATHLWESRQLWFSMGTTIHLIQVDVRIRLKGRCGADMKKRELYILIHNLHRRFGETIGNFVLVIYYFIFL